MEQTHDIFYKTAEPSEAKELWERIAKTHDELAALYHIMQGCLMKSLDGYGTYAAVRDEMEHAKKARNIRIRYVANM